MRIPMHTYAVCCLLCCAACVCAYASIDLFYCYCYYYYDYYRFECSNRAKHRSILNRLAQGLYPYTKWYLFLLAEARAKSRKRNIFKTLF